MEDFQGRFSGQEEGEVSTLKKKKTCALFHAFAKWNPLNLLYVYFLKGYQDLCQYLHDSTWFSTGDRRLEMCDNILTLFLILILI